MPNSASANGRKAGVVLNWKEYESRVSGYSYSSFNKGSSKAEAAAFVLSSTSSKRSSSYSHQPSSSGGSYSSAKSTSSKTPKTKNSSGTQQVYPDGASRGTVKYRTVCLVMVYTMEKEISPKLLNHYQKLIKSQVLIKEQSYKLAPSKKWPCCWSFRNSRNGRSVS